MKRGDLSLLYTWQEIQLITLKVFSPSTRIRLGGIVSARSVKYLGKLATKLADQETRDSWWLELREEVCPVLCAVSWPTTWRFLPLSCVLL